MNGETREDNPTIAIFAWLACIVLLSIFLFWARHGAAARSASFGEISQIGSGWTLLKGVDSRFHPQEPPLARLLLAFRLRGAGKPVGEETPGWAEGDSAELGRSLLSGAAGRIRLQQSRTVSLVFGLILALGVFRWSSYLWGAFGGLFSLLLFIFAPSALGLSSLATVDMAATAFAFHAVYALWKTYQDPRWRRVLVLALMTGAAAASSYGQAGIWLVLIVLSLLGVFLGGEFYPLFGSGGHARPLGSWLRVVWNYIGALAICALATWLILGLVRGFDFSLDEYFQGLWQRLGAPGERGPVFFALGKEGIYSANGFALAPVLAFFLKTPPGLILCAFLGFISVRRGRVYDTAFLLSAALAALLSAAVLGRMGRAEELLLPQAILLVLAGGVFQTPFLARLPQILCGSAALIWLAAGAIRVSPNFFAYANILAGGPEGAVARFDARDRDRGFDAIAVRAAIRREITPVCRVYLPGFAQPADLWIDEDNDLSRRPGEIFFPQPGLYVVNLSALQSPSLFDIEGFRFHWLEDFTPERKIGSGVYLYRFEDANVNTCVYSPERKANLTSAEALWNLNQKRVAQLRDRNPLNATLDEVYGMGQFRRGMARLEAGDCKLAVEHLLDARRFGVLPLETSIGLARAYQALNRPLDVVEMAEAIRRLSPKNDELESLKQWLESLRQPATSAPASVPASGPASAPESEPSAESGLRVSRSATAPAARAPAEPAPAAPSNAGAKAKPASARKPPFTPSPPTLKGTSAKSPASDRDGDQSDEP